MSWEIKVYVIGNKSFPCYRLRWKDPATGRYVYKSSGVVRTSGRKSRREAEKAAGALRADLNAGRYLTARGISWADFRNRYEDEVLTGLAPTTATKACGVFNAVESILPAIKEGRLRELTAEKISTLQSELRKRGKAESTIAGYLAHLRAALQWAADGDLIPAVPKFKRIRRAKIARTGTPMKGRPITTEEFERMLAKLPEVVGQGRVAAWRHFLEGLWWSGLRLGESLDLYWDRPDKLCVDLSGKRPMLRIPAELEKGHKDRLLPVAPEFAEFLQRTPEEERKGRVFKLLTRSGGMWLGPSRVCRIGMLLGKAAGVKVATDARTRKVKYASLHDLRRSFGERWSTRVMPQVLMALMRHEAIQTTMGFYVGRNANTTADAVWSAYDRNRGQNGAIVGATRQNQGVAEPAGIDVTSWHERVM